MEMDLARAQRGGESFDIQPAHHEDASIGHVLDDADHQPAGVPGDRGRVETQVDVHGSRSRQPRHAGIQAGTVRTGSPAAAMTVLTSAIE